MISPTGRARLAALLLCTGLALSGARPPAARADEAIWEALREPGAVVVLRHSHAPGSFDPPDARLDDCSTQRNLDEAGRAQARRTGEAFRQHGITVGRVLASRAAGAWTRRGWRSAGSSPGTSCRERCATPSCAAAC